MSNGILSILSKPFEGIANGVRTIVGAFITDPTKKAELEAQLHTLIAQAESEAEQTLRKELEAKERIIVAELQQDDKFTKRARPTVIYAGLAMMFVNHILLPWVAFFGGSAPPPIVLPPEFWWGWSGIVATYAVGRSLEKRSTQQGEQPGRLVSMITGRER